MGQGNGHVMQSLSSQAKPHGSTSYLCRAFFWPREGKRLGDSLGAVRTQCRNGNPQTRTNGRWSINPPAFSPGKACWRMDSVIRSLQRRPARPSDHFLMEPWPAWKCSSGYSLAFCNSSSLHPASLEFHSPIKS